MKSPWESKIHAAAHGGHHSRAVGYTMKDCGPQKGCARAGKKVSGRRSTAKKSGEGLTTDSTAEEARIKEWSWAWEKGEISGGKGVFICLCFSLPKSTWIGDHFPSVKPVTAMGKPTSNFPVLIWTQELFHPIFSPFPAQEGKRESSWMGLWQPAKANSSQRGNLI